MSKITMTFDAADLEALTQALHDFKSDRGDRLATAVEHDDYQAEVLAEYQAAHRLWNLAVEAE